MLNNRGAFSFSEVVVVYIRKSDAELSLAQEARRGIPARGSEKGAEAAGRSGVLSQPSVRSLRVTAGDSRRGGRGGRGLHNRPLRGPALVLSWHRDDVTRTILRRRPLESRVSPAARRSSFPTKSDQRSTRTGWPNWSESSIGPFWIRRGHARRPQPA